ncbi:gas vesicle protein GvpG [Embleya sp. NPDC005575]|uniref:gas vesicle protein GvpG n=1 Tax=Embleya sp. NPDC005575 TaxID=3156892 RepID=UPI0033BCBB81
MGAIVMGLITGLLSLPLAPVHGVVWLAEQVYDEAYDEWASPQAIRRGLEEVDHDRSEGLITDEEADALEKELVGRLLESRRSIGGLEV